MVGMWLWHGTLLGVPYALRSIENGGGGVRAEIGGASVRAEVEACVLKVEVGVCVLRVEVEACVLRWKRAC